MVGPGGLIRTSPDLVTWTDRNSGTTVTLHDIIFVNNQFVTVGDGGTVLISPDGINWTARNSGITRPLFGIAFGDGQYIAVGAGGLGSVPIIRSTDTVSWSLQATSIDGILWDVTFFNNLFVAVGGRAPGGCISDSYFCDGITWTERREYRQNSFNSGRWQRIYITAG